MFSNLSFKRYATTKKAISPFLEHLGSGVPRASNWNGSEILAHLSEHTLYNENNIVAFNKPPGLPVASTGMRGLSLQDMIPRLLSFYECKQFLFCKAPAREASGLAIAATSMEAYQHIMKTFKKSKYTRNPLISYLAITANPVAETLPKQGTLSSYNRISLINGVYQSVKEKTPSKLQRKRARKFHLKHTNTNYEVQNSSELASLLCFRPTSRFKDQLRMHALDLNAPLLGDHLYSQRITRLLGSSIIVPSQTSVPDRPQKLDSEILKALQVPSISVLQLPLFLHLERVEIPHFKLTSENLSLCAPPLPYFQNTLFRLKLVDEEGI